MKAVIVILIQSIIQWTIELKSKKPNRDTSTWNLPENEESSRTLRVQGYNDMVTKCKEMGLEKL